MTTVSDHDRLLGWLDEPPHHGIRFRADDGSWQRWSYEHLADRTLRAASALVESGVRRGDVVPMVVPAGPDFFACFYGLLALGATPSVLPLPSALQDESEYAAQLGLIASHTRASSVLAAPEHRARVQRGAETSPHRIAVLEPRYSSGTEPPRARGDLALVQFTSGSLSRPRGLRITVENLVSNLVMIRRWLRLGDWYGVSWLPMSHNMGLIGGFVTPVAWRMEHAVMRPEHFLRDPLEWLVEYGRGGYGHLFMPNFGFQRVLAGVSSEDLTGLDFSAVTSVISGGERINPETLARFAALLEPHGFDDRALMPVYGLAEGTLAITGVPKRVRPRMVRTVSADKRIGDPVEIVETGELDAHPAGDRSSWQVSCGRPLEGLDVRVVDERDRDLPEGVLGEVVVRGASVAHGYLDGSEDTLGPSAGAVSTRDAGFFVGDDLFLVGRLGDSIKVRGRAVFVEDLEVRLNADPRLVRRNLTVVGGVRQNRPALLVVSERLSEADVPVVAELVRAPVGTGVSLSILHGTEGSVPRTASGKPRRRALWQRYIADELEGEWLLVED